MDDLAAYVRQIREEVSAELRRASIARLGQESLS